MRAHSIRRFLVTIMVAVLLITPVNLARAGWVTWSTPVDIYNFQWYHYSYVRYTTYSPYGIWFQELNGPPMSIRWRGASCAGTPQYGWGPILNVSNSDPAPGVYLKSNGSWPSYVEFCLSAIGNGGNAYDEWTGQMDWDGV